MSLKMTGEKGLTMPNWVKNTLTFNGHKSRIDELVKLVKSEDNEFDFEKVIPMPENIFRGNLGIEEERKYGRNNWYDWSIEHWGTKWNSNYASVSKSSDGHDAYAEFETAWSAPEPVIKALSKKFPDISIEHRWADEDIGFNLGARWYLAGRAIGRDSYEEGTADAMKFACRMWGYDYNEYMDEING